MTPKRWNDEVQFNRDDDWAYKVARYMDMRVNQADYGVNVLPVDLYETYDGFIIQAPAVGAKTGVVDVQSQQDVLVVRIKVDDKEKEEARLMQIIGERPRGLFARRLTLPGPVSVDRASARVENGLLTIRLPRGNENGSRRVNILFADPPGELWAVAD
jgi:HSP20 family protein